MVVHFCSAGSSAKLSNPTAVRPTFRRGQARDYALQLIVNDGRWTAPRYGDHNGQSADGHGTQCGGHTPGRRPIAILAANLTVGTVTTATAIQSRQARDQPEPNRWSFCTEGSAVSLVVFPCPAPVIVPNVVGMTQAAAETVLVGAGLKVGAITTQYSDTSPQVPLSARIPLPGFRRKGNSCQPCLSLGPAPVIVPNVVGWPSGCRDCADDSGPYSWDRHHSAQ